MGVYVQTQVTSEFSVPACSPTIETVEDLKEQISARNIFSYVDAYPLEANLLHSLFSDDPDTGAIGTWRGIARGHFESYLSLKGECYKRARDGTHVYITSLDFAKRKAAYDWDLSTG